MAKLQVVNPSNNKAVKPARQYRVAGYAFSVVQLILQGVVIYLLLTR